MSPSISFKREPKIDFKNGVSLVDEIAGFKKPHRRSAVRFYLEKIPLSDSE